MKMDDASHQCKSHSLQHFEKYLDSIGNVSETYFCRLQVLYDLYFLKRRRIGKKSKLSWLYFPVHLFLVLISIFTLVKARLLDLSVAQYLIDKPVVRSSSSDDLRHYDPRSRAILSILPPRRTVNFFHTADPGYSLMTFFWKSNAVYIESLVTFFPVIKKKPKPLAFWHGNGTTHGGSVKHEVINAHGSLAQYSLNLSILLRRILSWLNVQVFVMLDDARHTVELRLVCQDLGIKTIGYMHGRFNEHHVGLMRFPFTHYLVWSEYFRDLYVKHVQTDAKPCVHVVGAFHLPHFCPKIKNRTRPVAAGNLGGQGGLVTDDPYKVLLIAEENIDYAEVRPYLEQMRTQTAFRVLVRSKHGMVDPTLNEIMDDLGIKRAPELPYPQLLQDSEIAVVIGTHSTALMESWLWGVPSILLETSDVYGDHLGEDRLSLVCRRPDDFATVLRQAIGLSQEERDAFRKRCWSAPVTDPMAALSAFFKEHVDAAAHA